MSSESNTDGTSPSSLDRERYMRKMSDRLHDRFLERPAFLDLDFIRSEIRKLDSQIDELNANGQPWPAIMNRLGDPVDYADAIFAQRLLSPVVAGKAPRTSILVTVLKVLFVVAPVNFLVAIGPLLVSVVIVFLGWVLSLIVLLGPIAFGLHSLRAPMPGVGWSEILLLIVIFSLGWIATLAMVLISRLMIWVIWSWLDWNIAFLRAEPQR